MENTTLPQFDRNRHGGFYDRGAADAYYGREPKPHWWPEGTYCGEEVLVTSAEEVAEYMAGYTECTDRKEW
jgi:hypothetical protein